MNPIDQLNIHTARLWDTSVNSHALPSSASLKALRLLRLAILRDYTRQLHTLKSEFLAQGQIGIADEIGTQELFLNSCFTDLPVGQMKFGDILDQLSKVTCKEIPSRANPIPSLKLPEELIRSIGVAKLVRQDRGWERAIVEEAAKCGWSFWKMEAWVEIHQVEVWARSFSNALWPRGIVVFVESDGFLRSAPDQKDKTYWRGRWVCILETGITDPKQLGIDYSLWPGSQNSLPDGLPQWGLLHPLPAGST